MFTLPLLLASSLYFTPPSNWETVKPKENMPYMQIGFLGKGSSEFRPSITFATEQVDVSLKEYVRAVKKIHTEDPNISWRDLGEFKMQAGNGRLVEISSPSAWGDVKILQAIFVKEHTAYILTGSVLKEEFIKHQSDFLGAFRSLSIRDKD